MRQVFCRALLDMVWSGVLMILFALMTGAGATTVRACIMGLIGILAQYMGRPAIAMRSFLSRGRR
jgi:predicted membrane metal-binding protein